MFMDSDQETLNNGIVYIKYGTNCTPGGADIKEEGAQF